MRYFFFIFLVLVITVLAVFGFRGAKTTRTPVEIFNDMDHQAKFKSQTSSAFFADGRGDRLPVAGTVPFSVKVEDSYLTTGLIEGNYGDGIPVTVDARLLARGQERFNINCKVCHGATGAGNGIVAEYGFAGIANYHQDRIRQMPDGQIYYTIVHGKGLMYGLPHIAVDDRWAIVAYVRALQRSQNARIDDVPESEREQLK
ncbi:MAG: cytochrome c [Candidatus Methylacidiphilales bacterium]|nr:cytochrome c [Candidatus Methylacidiphilales bacterium]